MKQIPRETIEEIRARNDIADVIGSYLPLRNAGGRFKALCPFHKEKSPSFVVSPDRQIYHCFGCGAGGDVIRFVQEYEKVDFMTALQMLADRIGLELKTEEGGAESGADRRLLFRIHDEVAQLYHQILLEHSSGAMGRAYLETRALRPETVREFQIGFAPEAFDTLEKWARQKKIAPELMEQAGLMGRSSESRGFYDRFRNRLMFPIRDEAGRVIGFSGRAIVKDERSGKYVNSPETPLFHKSRVLFAIDKARRAMAETRTAIVCEGQIDAIRCHEAGLVNVVASQGTALTSDHARMIRRYADEVLLVLDADAAGQKAALKSSAAFIAEELSVRVASLPPGEDPDSLVRDHGAEALRARIADAVPALDFLIRTLSAQEDLRTEAGLMRVAREAQLLIAQAPGAVQRERMIESAAAQLGLSVQALNRDLSRRSKRPAAPPVADLTQQPAPESAGFPEEEVLLLQLLLRHPAEVLPVAADHLPPEYLTDVDCRLLFNLLLESPDGLIARVPAEQARAQRLAARIEAEEPKLRSGDTLAERAAQDVVLLLWRQALTRRRSTLPSAGGTAEAAEMTWQLYHLKQGWEHAVRFMAV
jgi:DNA primase